MREPRVGPDQLLSGPDTRRADKVAARVSRVQARFALEAARRRLGSCARGKARVSWHAPQRVVVANQVVRPVPEDDLAEVAHDFEVLPLVVGTPCRQGHQAATLSKRVDHIAAQEACAAEDADTQAADGVSAAWTARSDARLHCQWSGCRHRCCVCPSLTALRRRADGATCGARTTRRCPVHGAELFARGAMLNCGSHVIMMRESQQQALPL
jgi:hypothetical protein